MSAAIRFLAAALLAAGCTFDASGTLATGSDAGGTIEIVDAMRASSEEQPIADDGGLSGDGGALADAASPVDATEAPPDAKPDEDDCGGFGQDCCDEGDACGVLLACIGGTCI